MNPKRNPDIETRMLPDGHVVIFSNKSDWAHTVTPLAAIAWEFCDGEHSIEDISKCVQEYANNADAESLQGTISDLVSELAQSGLVSYTK